MRGSYRLLRTLQTKNTVSDSFDLYYGLFMYNINATEQASALHSPYAVLSLSPRYIMH